MITVNFYNWNEINNDDLLFAVIVARYKNKWILAKHKQRSTWEIPGGHRECREEIKNTAIRELKEETGASKFEIVPICIYSVSRENKEETKHPLETYGGLFFADVSEVGELPNFEIGEISLFDELPKELTYPEIQPHLFDRVKHNL